MQCDKNISKFHVVTCYQLQVFIWLEIAIRLCYLLLQYILHYFIKSNLLISSISFQASDCWVLTGIHAYQFAIVQYQTYYVLYAYTLVIRLLELPVTFQIEDDSVDSTYHPMSSSIRVYQ